MLDDSKKLKLFTRRAVVLGGMKFLFFTTLGARFYNLQIQDSEKYTTMSYNNTINLSLINPMRGLITDQKDVAVATNIDSFNLIINSYDVENVKYIINQLNTILPKKITISDKALKRLISKSFMRYPLVILSEVQWDTISQFEFHSHKFPDVIVEQSFRRHYPFNDITCHITGYTAHPNKDDLKNSDIKHANITIGKNGIEKIKNDALIGEPGYIKKEVNSRGVSIRDIDTIPPKHGEKITLSIDMNIQKLLAKGLKSKAGASIVMDIHTGHILGMYSSPSYDPNMFAEGITSEEWKELVADDDNPLINKCISTPYPPGSTFKIISALAMLAGGVKTNQQVHCTGEYELGNRVIKCWKKKGHGTVNMNTAIAQSCNVYFYKMADMAGIDNISRIANILGFNSDTGIELPFENSGLIPNRQWKRKQFRQEWQRGDTVNAAIGQGYVLTTPIQLATMISRVASGKTITPSLIYNRQIENIRDVDIPQKHLYIVRKGLYNVFNRPYGTGFARRIESPAFKLSGKTGTAQVASLDTSEEKNIKDHGLFVGYAPFDNPKYAIATVVEHSSWGSVSALPISRSILYQIYRHYHKT